MKLSLKARLLVWLLPSLTVLLVAACAGVYVLQRELLYRQFDRRLGRQAFAALREARGWGRRPPDPNDPEEPEERNERMVLAWIEMWRLEEPDPVAVTLWPDGHAAPEGPMVAVPADREPVYVNLRRDGQAVRVLVRRRPMRMRRRPRDRGDRRGEDENDGPPPWADEDDDEDANDAPARARSTEGDPNARRGDADGERRRRPRVDHLLLVAGDLSSLHAALRVWLAGLAAAGVVGEAFVVTVVLLAVGRGLRPLRAAASEVASIDDRTLSRRVSQDAPHELEPVVRQINGMLDRLEAAFERERGFIANAAHELRTPLAGLRSRMEVSLRRPREPEAYRQALREGLEAIESLQRLVESLMELARLESGRRPVRFEPVDVAEVVRSQWAEVEDTARQRGVRFDDRLGDSLTVETDAVLAGRIAANLLANAAEYAPSGAAVEVGLERSESGVRLWVSNEADGLDGASAERLFAPFWRGDVARSATGRHAGLGLSIVRRCAEALGGAAGARIDRGRVRVWVDLPSAEGPR